MATIHFALDAVNADFTLAADYGHIVGMALSLNGLREQGFHSSTYVGNRLSTIDTTTAGWSDDCEPGWYRTPTGVQIIRPATASQTALAGMVNAAGTLHEQLLQWDLDVAFYGPGHPDWQRAFAHDALSSCHGHVYLTLHDTSNSVADRTTYCETLLAGASDGQSGRVASALQYYQGFGQPGFNVPASFSGMYPERAQAASEDPPTGTTIFYAWAGIGAPSTALTLGNLNSVQGTIPPGTVIGRGATWHDSITA